MPKPSKASSNSSTTRKRKVPGTGVWKKVDVSIRDDNGGEDDNHYDNRNLQKRAANDLEAVPGEGVGFFLGLEVIGGNDYRVENRNGTKMLVIHDAPNDASDVSSKTKDQTAKSSIKNREREEINRDNESCERPKKKRKNKRKKEKKPPSTEGDGQETEVQGGNDVPSQQHDKDRPSEKPSETERVNEMAEKNSESAEKPDSAKTLRKKKKKKAKIDNGGQLNVTGESAKEKLHEAQVGQMQTTWMSQTGGVTLHEKICKSLLRQNFWTPTPIQAGCLPAAILGRRNIVGAAPTGSGKTLAFLLPIFQSIIEEEESRGDDAEIWDVRVKALILTPTRELAKQIAAECEKILGRRAALVVGGLAHVKQQRLLSRRPPIVIGTPGRLWEMISSTEDEHLADLSQIKFLVIDEADRMIQMGSFPQLSNILDQVQHANPMEDDDADDVGLVDENVEDADRMLGLPGLPGEARVKMLSVDILRQVDALHDEAKPPAEAVEELEMDISGEAEDDSDEEEISLPAVPPVHRQTFVFSATLTLPATNAVRPVKKRRHDSSVGGAISEILDKSHAKGKTKVVDLSTHTKGNELIEKAGNKEKKSKKAKTLSPSGSSKFQLPPGLELQQLKCTQKHKDSYLYGYIMTTAAGNSGPCLVFCNSIAGVRRVGKTLQTLGLDVRMLHAQMQQRARFKAIEKLRDGQNRTIVVATDVAARGLDITSIRSVVHYDVARTVNTFVHRAGRTARGMGNTATGHSFSLISPAEDKAHAAIITSLNTKFDSVLIDGRLLREAAERVNLAIKVMEVTEVERKASQNNRWFKEQALEAGLDVDEDLLEEGLGEGKRERAKLQDAKLARERLAVLLSQPIQTQRHGKFLSTNSAAPSRLRRVGGKGEV